MKTNQAFNRTRLRLAAAKAVNRSQELFIIRETHAGKKS